MPRASETRDGAQQTSRDSKVRALEEQVRKLRYANDDLRSRLFVSSQRDNRLAEDLGFGTAEEVQTAISQRPQVFRKEFIEGAARTIEALEDRIANHIQLEKTAQEGLADAAKEIDRLNADNSRLRVQLEEVTRERSDLTKRVKELEGRPPSAFTTGLPTPATAAKKRYVCVTITNVAQLNLSSSPLPFADATPRNAASSSPPRPESTPGMLTVTPAMSSLPPLTLSVGTEKDHNILRAELRALHAQYEALRLVKERAESKYREDYSKWRNFKRWMFDEEGGSLSDVVPEGRAPNFGYIMKLRKRYMRTGPPSDSPGPSAEGARAMDVREAAKRSAEVRQAIAVLPDEFEHGDPMAPQSSLTAQLMEARQAYPPSTPPVQDTAELGSDRPAAPSSVSQGKKRANEETLEVVTAAAAGSPSTPRRKRQRYDDSSETEEESQALSPMLESQPGIRRLVPMPDGTYVRRGYGPYPGDAGQSTRGAAPPSPSTPRKPSTPGSRRSKHSPKSSPSSRHSTPRRRKERLLGTPTRRTPGTRGRVEKENPSALKGRPQDYSAYKGRGRYAAAAKPGEDTINAAYEIDTAQNNGLMHQFEEVVRDKERRKQLHGLTVNVAARCVIPSDLLLAQTHVARPQYYKAVGKLPARPQAPLWRSPHATPTKSTSSRRRRLADASGVPNSPHKKRHTSDLNEGDPEEEAAIQEHMQRISRHRQQWERPKTPYWEIAFPDTQEAAAINKRAKEMHEEKKARIEQEANRGGRYKKRKT
ncbi:uncharacterized protein B0H18DRAFT_1119573 [Fomitopsis serialis]|uniref:uncharacterized protein n=1 Tax=Fomitopsis serialis TaxID=139415 RepID=UPI0020086452|nr:uncharacterized protein B0H18DRAFT_1119573 [Neoantrodia serialis]KAH9925133.1 hypothetical protein B0H18DRAFT_1119573 [Neoantrodia serialis]